VAQPLLYAESMIRLLIVLLITACGSHGAGSECRESLDCDEGFDCSGPNDGPVCGIAPREGCFNDGTCSNGQRCNAIADTCSRDGVGSECGAACTSDAQCGPDFRCDLGACIAVLCTAGYTCPSYQRCDPSRITAATPFYDRHHGCFDIPCTTDGNCDQFCVNGICQTAAGTCQTPMQVP